jgi:hypothetical protein
MYRCAQTNLARDGAANASSVDRPGCSVSGWCAGRAEQAAPLEKKTMIKKLKKKKGDFISEAARYEFMNV